MSSKPGRWPSGRSRGAASGALASTSSSGAGRRGAVGADQGGGDLLGRCARRAAARPSVAVLLVDLDRGEQGVEQPLAVALADHPRASAPRSIRRRCGRRAASIRRGGGADRGRQDRGPLLAGAAGPAGAVLQRLGVARQLDMDDEAEGRQVDAARGDVGGDADPRAAVAQRLERVVALGLAVLARQGDRREAALGRGWRGGGGHCRGSRRTASPSPPRGSAAG